MPDWIIPSRSRAVSKTDVAVSVVFPSRSSRVSVSTEMCPGMPSHSNVHTMRSGRTISRNSPRNPGISPSGPRCTIRHAPPGRKSISQLTISWSDGVVTVSALLALPPIALLLSSTLELVQVLVQPVVALLPEAAVPLGPVGDLLEWPSLEPGGPPLPLPAPRDEPRPLEHFQVLRDRRQAHLERLRQLGDGGLPRRQPREDRPPRGIRESRERAIQPIGHHSHGTLLLNNRSVKYRPHALASSGGCGRLTLVGEDQRARETRRASLGKTGSHRDTAGAPFSNGRWSESRSTGSAR